MADGIHHANTMVTANDPSADTGTDDWNAGHKITADVDFYGYDLDNVGDAVVETMEIVGAGGSHQADVSAPLVVASESATTLAALHRASADAAGPRLWFSKARGTIGSMAAAQSGDEGMHLRVYLANSGNSLAESARFYVSQNGAAAAGTNPAQFGMALSDGTSLGTRYYFSHARIQPATASAYALGNTGAEWSNVYSDALTINGLDFTPSSGTWTPGVSFTGASTGVTYGAQTGHYRKVGDRVHVFFTITLTSKGTSTGAMRITGLPSAVAATQNGDGGNLTYWANVTSISTTPTLLGEAGQTKLLVRTTNGAATGMAAVTDSNMSNTSTISGVAVYRTA